MTEELMRWELSPDEIVSLSDALHPGYWLADDTLERRLRKLRHAMPDRYLLAGYLHGTRSQSASILSAIREDIIARRERSIALPRTSSLGIDIKKLEINL